MPSTKLTELVIGHHTQANHIAKHTHQCSDSGMVVGLAELKRVGRKFTTKVERRLRKLEMGASHESRHI